MQKYCVAKQAHASMLVAKHTYQNNLPTSQKTMISV